MKLSNITVGQLFILETLSKDETRYVKRVKNKYILMQGNSLLFDINYHTFNNLIYLGKVKEYEHNIYLLL